MLTPKILVPTLALAILCGCAADEPLEEKGEKKFTPWMHGTISLVTASVPDSCDTDPQSRLNYQRTGSTPLSNYKVTWEARGEQFYAMCHNAGSMAGFRFDQEGGAAAKTKFAPLAWDGSDFQPSALPVGASFAGIYPIKNIDGTLFQNANGTSQDVVTELSLVGQNGKMDDGIIAHGFRGWYDYMTATATALTDEDMAVDFRYQVALLHLKGLEVDVPGHNVNNVPIKLSVFGNGLKDGAKLTLGNGTATVDNAAKADGSSRPDAVLEITDAYQATGGKLNDDIYLSFFPAGVTSLTVMADINNGEATAYWHKDLSTTLEAGKVYTMTTEGSSVKLSEGAAFAYTINGNVSEPFAYNSGSVTVPRMIITWGDGTFTEQPAATLNQGSFSHAYASSGAHKVTILGLDGTLPPVRMNPNVNAEGTRVTAIHSALPSSESGMVSYFEGCTNLASIPSNLFSNIHGETSFRDTFKGCSSLQSAPSGLFSTGQLVTDYHTTFQGCSNLRSVGSGLFSSSPLASDFSSTFEGAGRGNSWCSLPDNLFAGTSATTLNRTFADGGFYFGSGLFNGSSLTSLPSTFEGSYINGNGTNSLPSGLFSSTNIPMLERTFARTNISAIPMGFFDNTSVTALHETFRDCTSLQSLPDNFFLNCRQITDFYYAFAGCISVRMYVDAFGTVADIQSRFEGIPSVDFRGAFQGMRDGTAPYLWQVTGTVFQSEGCFTGATGLSNYSDIPATWK